MTPSETNADSATPVRSSINVPPDLVVGLLGSADENLRALERILAADIHARGNALTLSGEPADVALAERAISELIAIVGSGQPLTPEVVRHSVAMLTGTEGESPAEVLTLDILSRRGKTIRPKTLNQKRYVDAIDAHTIVFAIGPAGTGKTYLAMAKAVRALQTKQVSRIILTRPAVEAGERLGFLPGTLSEKIDPYLRPLYDALHDMMDPELIPKLMSAGVIEVAPLAYMRGRTISDAFIILDEAQNTTGEQMKMFLTRLGFGSKIVVTGDITQVDLPGGAASGLRAAMHDPRRHRGHPLLRTHQRRRRAASAGRRHRRRLRQVRGARADEPVATPRLGQPAAAISGRRMSIEVSNESGLDVSEEELVSVARFAIKKMKVHPAAELSMVLLDTAAMADLHMRWMDLPGPTDVMSFPMDELEPGGRPDAPEPGPSMLGDIVLCPEFAAQQASVAGHTLGHELALLTIHGVLHLLGYDHAEPDEEKEMFALQRQLLEEWVADQVDAYRQDRQTEKDRRLLDKSRFFDEP